MSDLAEEEVRVLQLLERERSLPAMGFPEELRGAVTRLVERGLVWSLDTRGKVHFRVSTEGAARLKEHYEETIMEFERNSSRGDTALTTDEAALMRSLLPDGMVPSKVPEGSVALLQSLKTRGLVEELWKNRELPLYVVSAKGREALGVAEVEKTRVVELYMRSGNKVVLDGVMKFDLSYRDGKLVRVSIQQRLDARRLLVVQALDFSQVEAVTEMEGEK